MQALTKGVCDTGDTSRENRREDDRGRRGDDIFEKRGYKPDVLSFRCEVLRSATGMTGFF